MIQSYHKGDGELIADSLPKVGDTINIKDWGEALVTKLFHTRTHNYIEVVVSVSGGKSTVVWSFSVEEKE